ncbi:MAG: B12-binding domain-containing protein [Oscillospiraceae bacterium]
MSKIKDLLVNFDDEALLKEVQQELDGGTDPAAIIDECQDAMVEIGNLFSAGEMFVSDLMMAGAMFKSVSELVLPHLKKNEGKSAGKVVLGTVKDDIHDIGKDIVHNMLTAGGFEVIDLGVDVPPEAFVSALKESGAKVLALSCLLASCYSSILETVQAVEAAGLRDSVKIIIGGGPIDQNVVVYSGADTMGGPAQDTVNYCREVLSK